MHSLLQASSDVQSLQEPELDIAGYPPRLRYRADRDSVQIFEVGATPMSNGISASTTSALMILRDEESMSKPIKHTLGYCAAFS